MQAAHLTVWTSPPHREKAGVSRSTPSRFMPVPERVELVESTPIAERTEHRRNEARIAALPELRGARL